MSRSTSVRLTSTAIGLVITAAVAGFVVHETATEDDGVLPAGATVFDDRYNGVGRLDPGLHEALREAATDAGIEFTVSSGWRSRAYQERLLREAVAKYGSEDEAARWVATPETSPHVTGDAVDIGSFAATRWLSEHGSRYGLCQIYRNESWHFELRPQAIEHRCPAMYADPTQDPRMSRPAHAAAGRAGLVSAPGAGRGSG